MELLDERWTLLVVRELMLGSRHFNALHRGVPRMSPALLFKRLHTLVRAGVVERREEGNRVSYRLTEAGRELEPIVEAVGRWGVRWVPELGDEDLDPHLLLWDMHRNVDTEAVPDGRTVIAFVLPDVEPAARRWWIVVTVEAGLRTLTRLWRGDVDWATVLRSGELVLRGQSHACRALPRWLALTDLARNPRPVRRELDLV